MILLLIGALYLFKYNHWRRNRLKKISNIFMATALCTIMVFMSPTSIFANHGTNNWHTDKTLYECRNGDQYEIKFQHRHLENGRTEYRIKEDRTLIGICIMDIPEEG